MFVELKRQYGWLMYMSQSGSAVDVLFAEQGWAEEKTALGTVLWEGRRCPTHYSHYIREIWPGCYKTLCHKLCYSLHNELRMCLCSLHASSLAAAIPVSIQKNDSPSQVWLLSKFSWLDHGLHSLSSSRSRWSRQRKFIKLHTQHHCPAQQ